TASPVIRSTRNFLRENRQMVSQPLRMILGGSEAWKADQEHRWPLRAHNYELPTAASLARRTGPSPLFLAEAQRRLMGGSRLRISRRGYSEKEIQTEDISDERFLSAALLKCSSAEHQARSEGDEPLGGGGADGGGCSEAGLRVRRTASNFELGRLPEQRDAYQPGQYTLLRPLGGLLGIVPGALDQLGRPPPDQDTVSMCSRSSKESSPCVRQMVIPEVVDVVDQEDALSVDSQQQEAPASTSPTPHTPQKTGEPEKVQEVQHPVEFQKPENSGLILLAEEQRLELLEAARERQAQLIAEYNRLPISMGTLRVRNLKIILEQQLDVVDNDLSVLSQPKVYV
ncbi:hypothetical protein KR074_004005, partial [Drosophila pseudoananassae]